MRLRRRKKVRHTVLTLTTLLVVSAIKWVPEGYLHRGKHWKKGSVVFLRWEPEGIPRKRIVIDVGYCTPRNCYVAALWRAEDEVCESDRLVIVCQLTYLVPSFLIDAITLFEVWCGSDLESLPLKATQLLSCKPTEGFRFGSNPMLPRVNGFVVVSVANNVAPKEHEDVDEFDGIQREPGEHKKTPMEASDAFVHDFTGDDDERDFDTSNEVAQTLVRHSAADRANRPLNRPLNHTSSGAPTPTSASSATPPTTSAIRPSPTPSPTPSPVFTTPYHPVTTVPPDQMPVASPLPIAPAPAPAFAQVPLSTSIPSVPLPSSSGIIIHKYFIDIC